MNTICGCCGTSIARRQSLCAACGASLSGPLAMGSGSETGGNLGVGIAALLAVGAIAAFFLTKG